MPENTLLAFSNHGAVGAPLASDGGDSDAVIAAFDKAGFAYDKLAADLQTEGAADFVKSWNNLLDVIVAKSAVVQAA